MAEMVRLKLITTAPREEYPENGLENLAGIDTDRLLDLETKYTGNLKTVREIHASGEKQAREYLTKERGFQQSSAKDDRYVVLAFTVTLVVNRCHVTQVEDV